jgi:RNA polymerase sigma-70 factor (ECF subfamily)
MTAQELASLIDAHGAALVLYARQWSAAPEDLVQSAFLKLVEQRRPPQEPLPWLFRVVRNAAIDAARGERRRQRRELAVARPARWFAEPEIDGLDAEVAVAAMQGLPLEQREAIVAHLWGGLSFEEIGEVAGCSASSAFRRYSAGLAALRQELGVTCPNNPT